MSESKPNSATLSNASGNDKDLYLQSNDVNISGTQIEESLPSDEDDHIGLLFYIRKCSSSNNHNSYNNNNNNDDEGI